LQNSSKFAFFDKIQRRPVFNQQGRGKSSAAKCFRRKKSIFSIVFLRFFEILFSIIWVYSVLSKIKAIFLILTPKTRLAFVKMGGKPM
jgi:hypothetical protein